jgi:site-specific DNA-methyltransferase (adenine-specific)
MGMIVRVRAGIAGIAQLHLQGNVNGGIRLANSEEQHRQMEQQFDSVFIGCSLRFGKRALAVNRGIDAAGFPAHTRRMGTLYYGDNLDILRRYIRDESVDLVYLDPPFNSAQNYNAFFQEKDGTAAASQIRAFEDTWTWNQESQRVYEELILQPGKVSEVMQAFKTFLGTNDMMAYLAMMCPRLVELRRVLKSTGSLYLHCDPTASHYLKLLCDAIMGKNNFRSEVVWKRTSAHNSAKRFGPVHDVILLYSKTDDPVWNQVFQSYSEEYLEKFYRFSDAKGKFRIGDLTGAGIRTGESGRAWRKVNPTDAGRHWAVPTKVLVELFGDKSSDWSVPDKLEALDKAGLIYWPPKGKVPGFKRYFNPNAGVPAADVITDIDPIAAQSAERLGYPTQKPVALLERFIQASSNPGGLVLDPFCGCGTTIDAAEKNGRNWIGIDITQLATSLIKSRLRDTFGSKLEIITVGEPTTPNEAVQLAEDDKYQFQWWALGLVGARPVEQKKGADHGIDGKILFRDDLAVAKPEQIIIQVKGGKTGVKDVRDLRGVLDREKAAIGILISLQPATGPMETEAASAGFYEHKMNKQKYPCIQLRTVKELMDGKGIERPSNVAAVDETFKKAPSSKRKSAEDQALPGM